MKRIALVFALTASFIAIGQVESPSSESKPTPEVDSPAADTVSVPGLLIGVGFLPAHGLYRVVDTTGARVDPYTSLPIRFQVNATKLYKGFGIFGAIEFANAYNGQPFMDNASDSTDLSTWKTRYFRHMLGINYSFGKFGAYAGMDLFSRNGFFRSVGQGGTLGSGRKTLGVTYNAFKGLTVSLDFSAYAGPAVGVNYLVPLKGLK